MDSGVAAVPEPLKGRTMLAGSLNEFTMLDVFSLLATTRKTGVVNLVADPDADPRSSDVTGRVWVTTGQIAFAVADVSRAPLVARLLHSGEIAESAITDLVSAHTMDRTAGLPQLLESLGLPEDRVRGVVCDQVIDALFDMSRWADGNFSFSASTSSAPTEAPSPAHPTFDSIAIMDAVQERLQEWKVISEAVPSRDLVPGLVTKAATNADGLVQVDRDQWEILTLLDGSRTIADVIELTGQGVYTVSKRLAEMIEAGLVVNADRRGGVPAVTATLQLLKGAEQRTLGASSSSSTTEQSTQPSTEQSTAPATQPSTEPTTASPEPERYDASSDVNGVVQNDSHASQPPSWGTEMPALPEAPPMPATDMPHRQPAAQAPDPAPESTEWAAAASGPPSTTPEAEVGVVDAVVEAAEPPAPIAPEDVTRPTSVQVNNDLLSRLIGGVSRG